MISVGIYINGNPVIFRTAINTGVTDPYGNHIYTLDDNTTILHKRDDGAAVLAIKMLEAEAK